MTRLMDLPELPKLRILEYLPEEDLEKMRRTSRGMLQFIDCNRVNLAKRRMNMIKIIKNLNGTSSYYDVFVTETSGGKPDHHFVPVALPPLRPINRKRRWRDDENATVLRPNPMLWIAERLSNVCIAHLEFIKFNFRRADSVEFGACLQKRKVRIEKVILVKSLLNIESVTNLKSFMEMVGSRDVEVFELHRWRFRHLISQQFLDFMSSMCKVLIFTVVPEQAIPVPATFYKFPQVMILPYAVVLSVESVRRALHSWWTGELEVEKWVFNLPRTYHGGMTLSIELNLPCKIAGENPLNYLYTNAHGRRCKLHFFDNDGHSAIGVIGVQIEKL